MRTPVLFPLLGATVCTACDSVPLVAPTESTVRLLVADTSVPNGGSTTVSFEVTLSNESRAIRGARIDFGDGHGVDLGAVGRTSVAHTYGTEGAYTVTVTATDVGGYVTASSVVVPVDPPPHIPIAITPSPTSPVVGQAVTFTVEVSPPGNASAVRDVSVDFGDGSSTSLGALSGRGSVAHTYRNVGSYIVTATVLDAADRRHASSIGIVVAEDSEG